MQTNNSRKDKDELRGSIRAALESFKSEPLREAAITLLCKLGYKSDKTVEIPDADPQAFLKLLAEHNPDIEINKEKALCNDWLKASILFQLTDDELSLEGSQSQKNRLNASLLESYVFVAIELNQRDYARGKLVAIARQLNRVFPMPVMVFIKHCDLLSIAVINRRRNKRDAEKDVLGKVTIIRDISLTKPHRGHLDILQSFDLSSLAIDSFDTLHDAWEKIFDVDLLNKQFYKELSSWYFEALSEVRFPDDIKLERGEQDKRLCATGLIRLLTRLIFCWFLKEKGLIPEIFFDKQELAKILKSLDENQSTYYQAILQNLFFATLNQSMNSRDKQHRKFAEEDSFWEPDNINGIDNLYRYESLFEDPEGALKKFAVIPFLNGGLFECLDRKDENGKKIYVDGFSKDSKKRPHIPNRLFFGEGQANIGAATSERRRGVKKSKGLIDILSSYKFTIAENTPIDQEIALDPELLGKVFESLLASYNEEPQTTARKQTGSFYTPRPIVNYMVDESLKAHLGTVLGREHDLAEENVRSRLDDLFAYNEKDHQFKEDEVDTLIRAIDCCKILDPACGSGAFPMGVLHKLVFILTKLDLNNARWKQTQLDKLDSEPMRNELKRIFEKNNDDYGRKLYLIENCLYGVDIQPIAIQLTKLRFFISLICDQRTYRDYEHNYDVNPSPNPETKFVANHGVRPLPNLETKFVAADTLIGLGKDAQMHLQITEVDESIVEIEAKLQKVRHNYFVAQTRTKKMSLQKTDQKLREQLQKLMLASFLDQETSQKLAEWNPYDPHIAADFFEPLWMFDKSVVEGFDIVIGNPPYFQIEKIPKAQKGIWIKQEYLTYAAIADIFFLFYERGVKLLREDGHLCYITSSKWLRAAYGKKLRGYFSKECAVRRIVDFGGVQVFSSATVDTCILRLEKSESVAEFPLTYVSQDYRLEVPLDEFIKDKAVPFTIPENIQTPWVYLSKERTRIRARVEEQGIPLKDWDINIYRGVITGFNKAFYITTEQRNALIKKDPVCKEIIVRLLRGRFVERYGTKWDGTWMIATFPAFGYGLNKLPKPIVDHLSNYQERLEPKPRGWVGRKWNGRKPGSYRWFETSDSISYHQEFRKQKIIFPNMTKFLPFYFDRKDHYFCNQKCYIITGSTGTLPYLTSVLNSSLFKFCFRDYFPKLGEDRYELGKIYFEPIPIKKPTENEKNLFDNLVSMVQFAKKIPETDSELVAFLANLIDACVMECYFQDHMRDKDLLLHDEVMPMIESYSPDASEQEQKTLVGQFYKTANAPDHIIRNRMFRLTDDSPDLLAIIKREGA